MEATAAEQPEGEKPTETVEEAPAEGANVVNPEEEQTTIETAAESEHKDTEKPDAGTEEQNLVVENTDVNPEG